MPTTRSSANKPPASDNSKLQKTKGGRATNTAKRVLEATESDATSAKKPKRSNGAVHGAVLSEEAPQLPQPVAEPKTRKKKTLPPRSPPPLGERVGRNVDPVGRHQKALDKAKAAAQKAKKVSDTKARKERSIHARNLLAKAEVEGEEYAVAECNARVRRISDMTFSKSINAVEDLLDGSDAVDAPLSESEIVDQSELMVLERATSRRKVSNSIDLQTHIQLTFVTKENDQRGPSHGY